MFPATEDVLEIKTVMGPEERRGEEFTIQEANYSSVCLLDIAVEERLITVKLPLLFTLLTLCNSISATAGFTFNFTAELSHVP